MVVGEAGVGRPSTGTSAREASIWIASSDFHVTRCFLLSSASVNENNDNLNDGKGGVGKSFTESRNGERLQGVAAVVMTSQVGDHGSDGNGCNHSSDPKAST